MFVPVKVHLRCICNVTKLESTQKPEKNLIKRCLFLQYSLESCFSKQYSIQTIILFSERQKADDLADLVKLWPCWFMALLHFWWKIFSSISQNILIFQLNNT